MARSCSAVLGAVAVAWCVGCSADDSPTVGIERMAVVGNLLSIEFDRPLDSADVGTSAFRVSIARSRDGATTYYNPGFFFDSETFSCCDLVCGTHTLSNTNCNPTGDMCMSCTRVGPADVMRLASAEVDGNQINITLASSLTEAACDALTEMSTALFAHYDGSAELHASGESIPPFGEAWFEVETEVQDLASFERTWEGDFPLIPEALGATQCN